MESLDVIKKAKINNFSSIKKNMGKKPSNKDKDNDIVINLDINEISTILSQKSPKKSKLVAKRKILKQPPTISDEEKKKSIKKYGGYYDENDNFIIDYDINSDKDDKIKKEYFERFTEDELKYWKKISKTEKQLLFKLEKELDKYEPFILKGNHKYLDLAINFDSMGFFLTSAGTSLVPASKSLLQVNMAVLNTVQESYSKSDMQNQWTATNPTNWGFGLNTVK